VKTEIQIDIIGNTHNIGDTNIITPDFCIVKAEKCLYEDNMSRAWLKPAAFKFMFRLLDDDKETYFLGYCEKDSSFAPLDDYGASYGCTEIQYKVNRRWTTL
jgi:hypothetical protein